MGVKLKGTISSFNAVTKQDQSVSVGVLTICIHFACLIVITLICKMFTLFTFELESIVYQRPLSCLKDWKGFAMNFDLAYSFV